jgi:uncharacterized iron-regulated membrane protein
MRRVRKVIFWCHLLAGITGGVVVLIMSVSGALLAFQSQILSYVERDARVVRRPDGSAGRLGAREILAKALEARPDLRPSGLTIQAEASASAAVNLGREGALYVNPYTGTVSGESSKRWRSFFRLVEDWHRWLGANGDSRSIGKAVTGACNAAFLALAATGVFIWWPKKWTWQQLSPVVLFKRGLKGRARDFNWHNVTGVWCSSVLALLTATGLVMSYQWANNLLYTLTGSERPPAPSAPRVPDAPTRDTALLQLQIPANLNQLWSLAEHKAGEWQTISLRLPQRAGDAVVFAIEEGRSWNPIARSQLTVDAATGEVVKWEPYAGLSPGRRLRSWARSTHTGEAGRLPGQIIACVASLGGGLLVCTGFSLAVRRARGWWGRRSNRAECVEAAIAQGVPETGT